MFTPFAFVKQEIGAAGGRTDIPPYNPYAYYDATNTTYSSGTNIQDVVTTGSILGRNFDTYGAGLDPSYTSGQYWTFSNDVIVLNSGGALSDFLNSMGSKEHTIITLIYPTSTSEEDIVVNGAAAGGVLLMLYSAGSTGVRGHAGNSSALAVTDATSATAADAWSFASQRLTITSPSTARLDLFYGPVGSLPPTKVTGASVAYSATTNGPQRLGLGNRSQTGGASSAYDGRIAQIAIYDSPLSDSEVNEVMIYMKNRSGL